MTVTDRTEAAVGFTVPDGAALVAGAAVASVHIRRLMTDHELTGPGWLVVWGTFLWVALTAAGPFVYFVRRGVRRRPGYPKVGERLWALLGAPWLLTAVLQSLRTGNAPPWHEPLAAALGVGLAAVSMTAVAVVWATWVMVTPQQASQTFAAPWTNRVGLFLSVAWPFQCGAGMVVIG